MTLERRKQIREAITKEVWGTNSFGLDVIKELLEELEVTEKSFKELNDLFTNKGVFFALTMNMNDTFAWGCADAETLDADDFEYIFPLYQKYSHAAFIAYASVKRDGMPPQDPVLDMIREDFMAAKAEIEKLAEDGTILYEEWYTKNKDKNK